MEQKSREGVAEMEKIILLGWLGGAFISAMAHGVRIHWHYGRDGAFQCYCEGRDIFCYLIWPFRLFMSLGFHMAKVLRLEKKKDSEDLPF